MSTRLLPIPERAALSPSRGRFRRLGGALLLFGLLLSGLPAAAQIIYGLSGTDLTSINVASPTQRSRRPITGIRPGQTLVGIDFRPATGQLYALGYNPDSTKVLVYTLDFSSPSTVTANRVGGGFTFNLGTAADRIGFDFNPTVDRIRVVSTNEADLRLNPVTGERTNTDGAIAFAGPTPAPGENPFIATAAYTNSFIGATTTTLYTIDEQRAMLFRQVPPNNGTQVFVANISSTPPVNSPGTTTDLDIYTNPTTRAQKAYLNINTPDPDRPGQFITFLYALNLTNGSTQLEGVVGGGSPFDPPTNANPAPGVTDIAVQIVRAPSSMAGQLLYGVTANNTLISFYSGDPGNIVSAVPITGIAPTQNLVGTDFRPNTGELFGLGYRAANGESRLYTINLSTAVATPLGATNFTLDLGSTRAAINGIGFDFNPTVDRIRVTGVNTRNYRLNPNNPSAAPVEDGNLNFVGGTTGTPTIGSVAYTNSYAGSTSTQLYDIDDARNQLFEQTDPNAGQLTARGGTNLFPATGLVSDLDIYFDAVARTNRAFAVSGADTAQASTLYTVALASGTSTSNGVVGLGIPVRDLSAFIAPLTQPAFSGRLFYGIAGSNLISFTSDNPTNIRTAVNFSGLAAGQTLAGLDFRPLDGMLYAFGYNASTSTGQLYTVNLTTAALTPVGTGQTYSLGTASGVGFDFNPAADRIRIVGANGNNYRVVPTTGALATVNDGPTGRALSAGAYTNNDNNAATGTILLGYDQVTNEVVSFSDPNAGTNSPLGSSGIIVNPATGVDFDIYTDLTTPATPVNTGFATATPTTSDFDFLYDVNLTNGSFFPIGQIGNGTNLSGLAAFLTPAPVVVAGLTWTGATSTDWGTASNWSPMQVPTATDDVTIPNTTNDPVVSNAQQARNVTLGSGATLTTANGGMLTVNGSFTNNGGTTLGSGTGTIAFNGPAAQTISGTTTFFMNLTGGPSGLTTTAPIQVQRVLTLNGNLTSNGNLTLLSNATGTAMVVNNGTAGIIGSITVQRNITSANTGLGYRHYSSPVKGTSFADLATAGFTPVVNPAYNSSPTPGTETPFPTVFGYDQSRVNTSGNPSPQDFDKGFFSPNSLSDSMRVGFGYTVNIPGTETVDFVGSPKNGNLTLSGLSHGGQARSGYQLLGNPYPSPIDWDLVGRSNVDAAVYVFRSSGPYTGTYGSYVANSGGVGTNGVTDELPVAQGFFVRVSTPNSNNGVVSFSNAARLTAPRSPSAVFQRGASVSSPLVRLDLADATGRADDAVVYFAAGATSSFDSDFDAYKLQAGSNLLLASEVPGNTLAINGLPALTTADVLVALRVSTPQPGTYTLRATELANLPAGTFAYLRDMQTGSVSDLSQSAGYSFRTVAGAAPTGRFTLVITQQRILATTPTALAEQVSLYPNPARSQVTLSRSAALAQQITDVTLVNALGQVVLRRTLPANAATTQVLQLGGLAKGVYTLRLNSAAGVVAKRLVVE
ncbi:DUF4394 domain-containing protein [Hymenobacter sp. BT175]|uniref:DUF4394 domain-containing protein n=1 Tax=Hymenobacter translucens TaxID=2886507 RepID=UPI001D0E54CE|nr:DUF4394 domain-containing protein [Hymenobacter translucens]MCC2546566.1 DUF4394 domain-containing protein [Hymenobacter translucens]